MFNELIDNIQRLGVITAKDVERLSATELLFLIIERLNGITQDAQNVHKIIEEFDKLLNEKTQELVPEEVEKLLNHWKNDGTLDAMIDELVIQEFSGKVDKLLESEINALNPPQGLTAFVEGADITTALRQMVADGRPIFIPKGNYVVSGQIDLANCPKIYGSATLTMKGEFTLFKVSKQEVVIEGLTIIGDKSKSQTGISFSGIRGLRVRNMVFKSIMTAIYGTQCGSRIHETGFISDCHFKDCITGIFADTRCEYMTISNCVLCQCSTAIKIKGGNILTTGCQITDGSIGVHILEGENGGHGVISGCQINHNTESVKMIKVPNGYTITGNNIFYGKLTVDNCGSQIVLCGNTLACEIAITNSVVVANGNTFHESNFSALTDEASVVRTIGNITNLNSGSLQSAKYNMDDSMYYLEMKQGKNGGNTTLGAVVTEYLYLNAFKPVHYVNGLGQLIMSPTKFYNQDTGLWTLSGTPRADIEVNLTFTIGLDASYTGACPIIDVRTIKADGSPIQQYPMTVSVETFENGVRYATYSFSGRILGQRDLLFGIHVNKNGAPDNSIVRGMGSHFAVYGL